MHLLLLSYFKNLLFDDVFVDNRVLVVTPFVCSFWIGVCWSSARYCHHQSKQVYKLRNSNEQKLNQHLLLCLFKN